MINYFKTFAFRDFFDTLPDTYRIVAVGVKEGVTEDVGTMVGAGWQDARERVTPARIMEKRTEIFIDLMMTEPLANPSGALPKVGGRLHYDPASPAIVRSS